MSHQPPDDPLRRMVDSAMRGVPKSEAMRRVAIELAQGASLLLERANQFQAQAGLRIRYVVAIQEAQKEGPADGKKEG